MILTDEAVSFFKTQLQQSIVVCAERCLFNSVKWATEILDGIRPDLLDKKSAFTKTEAHLPTVSIYHNPYEIQSPALTELEYNRYQYAKALFQMRQFDGVTSILEGFKSPRLYFLRLYSKYLAGEKRKEEATQDILGTTEDSREHNAELIPLENELRKDNDNNELDSFSLYLYGAILRKRDNNVKASIVLLEAIRKYEYNWSAWAELAMLVKTQKQFDDIRALLNRCMGTSIIKEFFLAKLCIDLHQPTSLFREIMGPLTEYFPNSPYVTSQWAKMFYENMDYVASASFFEDLRESHPARLEDMDIYSNLLYLQGSRDKLCTLALECGKIDKYRAETCCVRANYYGSKREMSKSIEYFKRALKLNQSYPLVWTLLGHDYIEDNNTTAAIECYRRAVSINNRDFRGWYGLGQAHECLNLPYDAMFYYEKATDIRPNDSRMWKALAGCYKGLQQEKEMQDCYTRAVACDKAGKNSAMIQVGKIYEKMGKTNMAINYYHGVWDQMKHGEITSDLADISLKLAKYAMIQQNYNNAELYAKTALDAEHPYHEMAREILDEIRMCRESAAS